MFRNRYFLLAFALGLLLLVLSYCPVLARHMRGDETRVDILLHRGFSEDYMAYLSAITRGQNGHILFANPFISATAPKSQIIHIFYTLLGFISQPFHLWPPIVYHIGRVGGVILFIISIYVLAFTEFKKPFWAAITTILTLYVPIIPDFLLIQAPSDASFPWWKGIGQISFIDNPPHHMFAIAMMVLAVACLSTFVRNQKKQYLLAASILSVCATVAVPHTVLIFFLFLGIECIWSMRKRTYCLHLGLAGILPFCALLIMIIATHDQFWLNNRIWEVELWSHDPWFYFHYYSLFVFVILFALPTVIKGIAERKKKIVYLTIWAVIPCLMAPCMDMLGIGKGRFVTHVYAYIPIVFLAVITVYHFAKTKQRKIVFFFVFILTMVFSSLTVYQNLTDDWNRISIEGLTTRYYVPTTYYELPLWVKEHIPADSRIFVGSELGSLIAAFAPMKVYVGEQTHGYNWDLNQDYHRFFYQRQMVDEYASELLRLNNIGYVVHDIKLMWPNVENLSYPFLKLLWSNEDVGVYKVIY